MEKGRKKKGWARGREGQRHREAVGEMTERAGREEGMETRRVAVYLSSQISLRTTSA